MHHSRELAIARKRTESANWLGDRVERGMPRVETGGRILEDHLDFSAKFGSGRMPCRDGANVLAAKADATRSRIDQPDD
jgi:hypothetical protein